MNNPILPGFNGDPSILRVGEDYYIATSSFEWFPGVPIYHSRDLEHWRLLDNPLKTAEYLDLRGVRSSLGVWAPNLSYDPEIKRFYLLYSNVHSKNNWFFDVDNFLIWTDDIQSGKWSKPTYINSSGFDASLFHDDDGRKWILNKDRDYRPSKIDQRAIIIQEYDIEHQTLLGEPVSISCGATERRFVEGPNLYKRNGYYYLLTAEGGTGYGHCVAVLRSQNVTGPYEPSPYNPLVTSQPKAFVGSEADSFLMLHQYNPDAELQKAGHGSIVETQNGDWYIAYLCARPLLPQLRCILGRETGLQEIVWSEDHWPRLADGGVLAQKTVPTPNLKSHPFPKEDVRCQFTGETLPNSFYSTRNPIIEDWAVLDTEKQALRIRGRESLTSTYDSSLIARKLTGFHTQTTIKMAFEPRSFHHLAGLTCFYDNSYHYSAYKTCNDAGDPVLQVSSYIGDNFIIYDEEVPVSQENPVWFRALMDGENLQFQYSLDGEAFHDLGSVLNVSYLSDEAGFYGRFTGIYMGMFAQDSDRKAQWAVFDWFEYILRED